jgi:predicted phosphodiesterase
MSNPLKLLVFEEKQLRKLRKLIVVGDLHGDYNAIRSLLNVFDPVMDGIVFLGDYADRGQYGIEVIEVVNSLMKRYPRKVIALKGNHEDYTESGQPKFYPCDLINEAINKKGGWQSYFVNEFTPFVESLYLAATIPNEILFVHGGVSSKIRSLDDLRYPTKEIEQDVLWSDPFEGYGEYPNRRGVGIEFGRDTTINVCRRLKVKEIIRSHEPRKALREPYYEHDGRVITTSATSIYGGYPCILVINPTNFSEISWHLL